MNFNNHSELKDLHAFLGASQHSWLNYDEEKLVDVYKNHQAKLIGTELHKFAYDCIRLKQRLPRKQQTLNMYVNDAIGFRMVPEQPLFFSENCFGTCDAISFKKDFLRIHDLKTGKTPASMNQLFIYMALFCLEYNTLPNNIKSELRIYQNDEVIICNNDNEPDLPHIIFNIMNQIKTFDKRIQELKAEE